MRTRIALTVVTIGLVVAGSAGAWGSTGHRIVGEEALRALPVYMPDFLRSEAGVTDAGEYAREPDRWRGSGAVHDAERDPAHFMDLDDEGLTAAGLSLDQLPKTRPDYEAALRAKGIDPSKEGYLPYATIDAYQQVIKDMAYWRVLKLMEGRETDAAKKAWYHADRVRREDLTLRDIGILAHYVGDATQPMHLSIHYNGWGKFPNPEGYTTDKIHVPLEAPYVTAHIDSHAVRTHMPAYEACTAPIETCVATRLKRNFTFLIPLYKLEKDGGFAEGDPRGVTFMAERLGQGAGDLRDMLVDAWRESTTMSLGYKRATYDDFVAGRVADPYEKLYGDD
ncbi:MAG: hypothetical protein WBQ60_06850 [Asticcacaulis sp.]